MEIELVAFGNAKEAFVEKRFSPGLNVIYDFDNNKGKTILFQSMMYALGNKPVWPSGFNDIANDCFFITQIKIGDKSYRFMRKKDSFIVLDLESGRTFFFETVAELRSFLCEIGIKLPTIMYHGREHVVYPELFYQLFFVGQDGRSTSKISNGGMYWKDDFYNMVYSCLGINAVSHNENVSKEQINSWKNELGQLKRELKILKQKSFESMYLSYEARRSEIDSKIKSLQEEKDKFSDLRKKLNSNLLKIEENERFEKQIDAIVKNKDKIECICAKCGSKEIIFRQSGDFEFSVRDESSKQAIKRMIADRIRGYQDEVDRIKAEMDESNERIRALVSDPDVSVESLICHKQSIKDTDSIETRIKELSEALRKAEDEKKESADKNENSKRLQAECKNTLLDHMLSFYHRMDPTGKIVFDDIFSKGTMVFSGSEGSEFHISRMYAFGKEVVPTYPIIIDSFREGELSTSKEEYVLEEFSKLGKQVILSASLKESEDDRYGTDERINALSYEENESSHILSAKYTQELRELIKSFGSVCF